MQSINPHRPPLASQHFPSQISFLQGLDDWVNNAPHEERYKIANAIRSCIANDTNFLYIKDFPYLTSLPCLPPNIKSLYILGCHSLKYIPAFPPHLISLGISDCPELSFLPFPLPNNLISLEVSFCTSLKGLPPLPESLKELDITHCNNLNKLFYFPPTLTIKGLSNRELLILQAYSCSVKFEEARNILKNLSELSIQCPISCTQPDKLVILKNSPDVGIIYDFMSLMDWINQKDPPTNPFTNKVITKHDFFSVLDKNVSLNQDGTVKFIPNDQNFIIYANSI